MNQLKSKRSRDPRSSVVPNRSQDVGDSPSGGSRCRTKKEAQRYLETGARGVQRAHKKESQSSRSRIRSSLRLNLVPSDTIAPRSIR